MTFRAVLIGLLLAAAVAALGYWNDWVLAQAYVAGDLAPVSVYGLLILGVLVANPLLRLLRVRPFARAEWAVIVALMLVACVIPGPGLMWTFNQTLAMPNQFARQEPGWRDDALLDYAPGSMLVAPGERYDEVIVDFARGVRPGDGELLAARQIPWDAWAPPYATYLPLIALSLLAGGCMTLVVHRQWSGNERLRYPVAEVAGELMGSHTPARDHSVFRTPLFWVGFVPTLMVLLINGYHAWNLSSVSVPMTIDMRPLAQKWPVVQDIPYWQQLLRPTFYLAAVGFAYFVSTEVSLSVGVSHLAFGAAFLAMLEFGVDMQADFFVGGVHGYQMFGSFLGAALMVFYVGRKYYASVIARSLSLPLGPEVGRDVIWAFRLAVLAATAMVILLRVALGVDVLVAVLFVLFSGLIFLIIARIHVETGVFLLTAKWHAVGVLAGLFGVAAVGPDLLIVLSLLAAVMTVDPRVCLTPLAADGLRLGERQNVSNPRLTGWMIAAVLLALAVGVPATLYVQYNFGATQHGWLATPARRAFETLQSNLSAFESGPDARRGLELSRISPNPTFLIAAGVGVVLVLAMAGLRLRLRWWPIHPVLFLVWGTFGSAYLSAGFLLGWLIKRAVTAAGGGPAYQKGKPLFVGLVAGEFTAGIFWMLVGLIYYLATGTSGPAFRVHP